eukprot:COSAG02_NODE_444_length_22204_cov_21.041167_8_plen_218_part_00
MADVAAANTGDHADEPLVYESIGNGVDSKQITPKDTAIVKCVVAPCCLHRLSVVSVNIQASLLLTRMVSCRCVCGTVTDDGERMVACDKCGNWLHTRCIGLADGKDIPSDFSLTQHLRIKCCKHIRPASIDDMPKIYYCAIQMAFVAVAFLYYAVQKSNSRRACCTLCRSGGMGSPRQNIGGIAERDPADASTSPRSSYTGGRRGGTGNRAARAAGN